VWQLRILTDGVGESPSFSGKIEEIWQFSVSNFRILHWYA